MNLTLTLACWRNGTFIHRIEYTMMTISEAVFRSLTDGENFITGRDEKGFYAKFDRIEITLNKNNVNLWMGRTLVGTIECAPPTQEDTIIVNGLDGRFRIIVDYVQAHADLKDFAVAAAVSDMVADEITEAT